MVKGQRSWRERARARRFKISVGSNSSRAWENAKTRSRGSPGEDGGDGRRRTSLRDKALVARQVHRRGVPRIAVVCGAARCGEVNKVFLGSLEAALKVDPAWEEKHTGFFDRRPERGLLAFGHIYAGWGVGTEWYNEKRYLSAGYSSAEDFVKRSYVPGFAHCDADDLRHLQGEAGGR